MGPTTPELAVTIIQAGPGVGVGPGGVGVVVGVGVTNGGVGVGGGTVAVGVGVGAGVPSVVIVIKPSFCATENVSKSSSINWKLFGDALHAKGVKSPGVVLTRFQ